MAHNLKPPLDGAIEAQDDDAKNRERIRLLSRSPHPYHRRTDELLEPSGSIETPIPPSNHQPDHEHEDVLEQLLPSTNFTKDSTPEADSGSEADDELFVKRLPAPKATLHKGLRGRHELLSETPTPLSTPTTSNYDHDRILSRARARIQGDEDRRKADKVRRTRELKRRLAEVLLIPGLLVWLVFRNPDVKPVVAHSKNGEPQNQLSSQFLPHASALTYSYLYLALKIQLVLFATLLLLYPVRVAIWAWKTGRPLKSKIPLLVPSSFEPAPLIYPQVLPIVVACLTAANVRHVLLPNLILSVASWPTTLIPAIYSFENINVLHWCFTCIPLIFDQAYVTLHAWGPVHGLSISAEELICLYPLHQSLSALLRLLIRESLLPAEHQLLSISLINLLIVSTSPQAVILQALLWIGGLLILTSCGPVVQWSIKLSMVRKWRFRRNHDSSRAWMLACFDRLFAATMTLFSSSKLKKGADVRSDTEESAALSGFTTDEDDNSKPNSPHRESVSLHLEADSEAEPLRRTETVPVPPTGDGHVGQEEPGSFSLHARRRTLPFAQSNTKPSKTHTFSGRPKRSVSASIRVFFGLTAEEAVIRKWEYAMWVYVAIIATIFIAIRAWVQDYALYGNEPVGWALGYLFGDIAWFRMQVVSTPILDRWICLPSRVEGHESCHLGWIEHLRHATFGEANSRLLLAGWWALVIVVGLAIVFRLSAAYEVDTRRKVFHFMMVTMFLPIIYIDPTWCALALSLVLAIFLLLDLLRASQLPPLSKPIMNFLQPYTDGRDHLGPVVISHIFLLIGCAIPLWLSLASLPRTGAGTLKGWEVPTRDLSMVTGVVCVGLGDAAASLCGRRWGKHKWCWKGGKSLEGSAAFAAAVFVGLTAANVWLRLGGWAITGQQAAPQGLDGILTGLKEWDWPSTLRDTGLCAAIGSLTEAVLTGGNDNVVVPVVLWTCVKSTAI